MMYNASSGGDMSEFAQAELAGWSRNAADYDALVLPATSQAFDVVIENLGTIEHRKLLEMASGTGHLAKRLADQGAEVATIDFAPEMIHIARKRFPAINFIEADCEKVPFKSESFDAVICCFGALHFARPDRVFGEAYRVLRPGGQFVFTIWLPPEEGGDFLGMVLGVYQRTADMSVGIPAGPPMFELANVAMTCKRLEQLGFESCDTRDFPVMWSTEGPEGVVRICERGLVRTRMILELQTSETRTRILGELRREAEKHTRDGRFEMKNTARQFMAKKLVR
jgi:ubiquinone/menaquinone biosynthesis C-methylase UbiE